MGLGANWMVGTDQKGKDCYLVFWYSHTLPFLILPLAAPLLVVLFSLVTWEFLICLKFHPASLSYVSSLLKFSLATLKQS